MNLIEQLSTQHPALVIQNGQIKHFGDQNAELGYVHSGETVLGPLLHYGVLQVSGEDATSFLQSQLTNDVAKLPVGAARHAAWCTAKGRMLASFIVLKQENNYLILLANELLEPIQKRLRMFVLRSKVLIEAKNDHVVLGLAGNKLSSALNQIELSMLEATDKQLTCQSLGQTSLIRLDGKRLLIVVAQLDVESEWKKFRQIAQPVGAFAWQWLDIQAGLPVITGATTEMFVPQMVDFDTLGGVSFNKGCYPGQEIVARTHYLGKVKRHLYRTHAATKLVAGQEIHSPNATEQTVAQVVTATPSPQGGWDALVVVLESVADSLTIGEEVLVCAPVYPQEKAEASTA